MILLVLGLVFGLLLGLLYFLLLWWTASRMVSAASPTGLWLFSFGGRMLVVLFCFWQGLRLGGHVFIGMIVGFFLVRICAARYVNRLIRKGNSSCA